MAHMGRLELLRWQFPVSWGLLRLHLDALTEESLLWAPHADSWTVRPGPSGWVADWQVPEPERCPPPTLAWLLWHLGWWWSTAYERSFGTEAPARESVRWPGDLARGRDWMLECHDRWAGRLDGLTEADLDGPNRTEWLPPDLTLGHVLSWVNLELIKNAADIGAVRRLYEVR